MARSHKSQLTSGREWHLVSTGYLRTHGINTPIYRADSWEIDWEKRNHKLVWARNPLSKMPKAREWHWIDHKTLDNAGIEWKPIRSKNGRYQNSRGYVILTRPGMTDHQIELANRYNLWMGRLKRYVFEHRVVAAEKYGELILGAVVRHKNGIKSDNRKGNLLIGTKEENNQDHDRARLSSLKWKQKYFDLLKRVSR